MEVCGIIDLTILRAVLLSKLGVWTRAAQKFTESPTLPQTMKTQKKFGSTKNSIEIRRHCGTVQQTVVSRYQYLSSVKSVLLHSTSDKESLQRIRKR